MDTKTYELPTLTIEELEVRLAGGLHSGFYIIPPATALHIIAHLNTHNRKMRPIMIKRWAKMMTEGKFLLNGESIVFTDRQRLGDGQNRLKACVDAKVSFASLVCFGIDEETFATLNSGTKRSQSDALKLVGAKYPEDTAVAVKWVEWIESGRVKTRPGITAMDLTPLFLNDHRGVEDFIPEARKIAYANKQSVGTVAAFLHVFNKIDGALAADFSIHWAEGTRPPRFAAITAMQSELEHMRNHGMKGGHLHEITRAAMIVNAWNAVIKGRQRGFVIKWDSKKSFPKIEGQD